MKKFNTITGEQLLSKELEPIPFVVDELIPTGLTLLAGSAKIGKSWLALWLSVQIARGEKVWDYDTAKSTTLYLCYEDNEIRIQNRLLEITEDAPDNVHFVQKFQSWVANLKLAFVILFLNIKTRN